MRQATDQAWREEMEQLRAAHEVVASALRQVDAATPAADESAALRRAVGRAAAAMRQRHAALPVTFSPALRSPCFRLPVSLAAHRLHSPATSQWTQFTNGSS